MQNRVVVQDNILGQGGGSVVFYVIAALVFGLLVAVFAVQNPTLVAVRFLRWEAETSIVMVILTSAAAGAAIMGLTVLARQIRLTFRLRQSEGQRRRLEVDAGEMMQEIDRLEQEVASLRAQLKSVRHFDQEVNL